MNGFENWLLSWNRGCELTTVTFVSCLYINGDTSYYNILIISFIISSVWIIFLLLSLCCWLLSLWFRVLGERNCAFQINGFFASKNLKNAVSYLSVNFIILFSHLSRDHISSFTHSSIHSLFNCSIPWPLSFLSIISSISPSTRWYFFPATLPTLIEN